MNIDFTGVQRVDEVNHYSKIVMVESPKCEDSRLRMKGHASYRCTRGFKSRNVNTGKTEN